MFPSTFKTAHIRPLLKMTSLDKNIFKNYRPVSNLSFVSKLIEKVVVKQLSDHMRFNDPSETYCVVVFYLIVSVCVFHHYCKISQKHNMT